MIASLVPSLSTVLMITSVILILIIPAFDLGSRKVRHGGVWAVAVLIVFAAVCAVASAQVQCPECFDQCCPDYVPYGICWPIGWWPC